MKPRGYAIAVIIFLASAGLTTILGLALGLTIVFILIVATILLFGKAYRTVELRQTIMREHWEGRQKVLARIFMLVFFLAIIVAALFLPSYLFLILYATEIPLLVMVIYSLKTSFPEKIPIEGVLAISFYGFSIITSFVLSLIGDIFGISTPLGPLWIATTLVFFFASYHALFHAPDELEVLVEE